MSDVTARFRAAVADQSPHLVDGDPEKFQFSLDKILLKSGTSITLEKVGVTAIVGANNSGKSTVLREVRELLSHNPGAATADTLSVGSLEVTKSGSAADALAWLGQNANLVTQGSQVGFQRMNAGFAMPWALEQGWASPRPEVGGLTPFLCFYGDAQGRFGIGGSAELRDSVSDPPVHPVHHLQDSKALFDAVSSITEEIFRQPLTLDALGRIVRLRVGRVDLPSPPVDNVPPEYRTAMAGLLPLDEQGDGMRSLLGQLLPIVSATFPLVIIDEPEAFLHPPQAHALGTQLGRLAVERHIQVVVATHDRNLLMGLLSSGVDTSVVRLERLAGAGAESHQLKSEDLGALWTDPVLKYTNVLDGLFHRLVVLAEAEADCGYLAAALDCPQRVAGTVPRSEILFVPTGGKDGMPKVAAALKAARVPTVAAPDLDTLSDQTKLRRLVESLGSKWTDEMSRLWNAATVDLRATRSPATVGHVLDAITAALEGKRAEPYGAEHREMVRAQMRSSDSPWAAVKSYGLNAFRGAARVAAEALVGLLDEARVVMVREGELECLAPEVPERKGPGWLQAALTAGAQCNAETQAHVNRILGADAP